MLNLIIDAEFYSIEEDRYMCDALIVAEVCGAISNDERSLVMQDIGLFLVPYITLSAMVKDTSYYRRDGLYIDIYKDWFKFKEDFIKNIHQKEQLNDRRY